MEIQNYDSGTIITVVLNWFRCTT